MVAPVIKGEPIRSFVRVPGSGSDPDRMPICCDLSNVANIAPANPLPESVLEKYREQMSAKKVIPAEPVPLASNKLKRTRVDAADNDVKKPRTEDVRTLIQERDELEKKNAELKRKLSMFHKLFQDRSKLNEVLRRLDQSV